MTTDHHPDLFGLLRGELTNSEVTAAGLHLETCEACRDDLAELAVGHAMLTSSMRTERRPAAVELPDVPELAAPPARGTRWLRPVGLVAAAAALVVGSVAVTHVVDRPESGDQIAQPTVQPTPTESAPVGQQSADLQPVEGNGGGRVVMASGDHAVTMTIETHDLPKIEQGQFYYVWLFNPKTNKMLPLGVVGPEGQASFEIPDSLVGRYQVVDVSLERDDGDPGHSVTSVLRADYGSGDGVAES